MEMELPEADIAPKCQNCGLACGCKAKKPKVKPDPLKPIHCKICDVEYLRSETRAHKNSYAHKTRQRAIDDIMSAEITEGLEVSVEIRQRRV